MNEKEMKKLIWGDAEYILIDAKNDILGLREPGKEIGYVFEYGFSKVGVSVVDKNTGEIVQGNEHSIGWECVGSKRRGDARKKVLDALAFINILQD